MDDSSVRSAKSGADRIWVAPPSPLTSTRATVDTVQAPTKISLHAVTAIASHLNRRPSLFPSALHQNGVFGTRPRLFARLVPTAHRQPAHDRVRHPLGPQVHLTSAPGQPQASPRGNSRRPKPHRLVYQRAQPRRRLYRAHRAHHGQPQAPQLFPATGEAWRGHICHCML